MKSGIRNILCFLLISYLLITPYAYGEEPPAVPDNQESTSRSDEGAVIETESTDKASTGDAADNPAETGDNTAEIPEQESSSAEITDTDEKPSETTAGGEETSTQTPTESTVNLDNTNVLQTDNGEGVIDAAGTSSPQGGTFSVSVVPNSLDLGVMTPGNVLTFTNAAAVTIIAKKKTWSLTVSGSDFTTGTRTISVDRMKVKLSTQTEYITLGVDPVTLLSNQPITSGTTINVDYQVCLADTDCGGDFSGIISFSIQ